MWTCNYEERTFSCLKHLACDTLLLLSYVRNTVTVSSIGSVAFFCVSAVRGDLVLFISGYGMQSYWSGAYHRPGPVWNLFRSLTQGMFVWALLGRRCLHSPFLLSEWTPELLTGLLDSVQLGRGSAV